MHSIQFWKSWAKVYQRIGLSIAGAFTFALLFFWYSWFQAPAPALTWFNVEEQELVQIPVHSFQQGLLELTVHGDNYIIFEQQLGEHLKPNPTAGYIFLFILTAGMVMMLTIVTTLRRFWYLLGMGLFILFIVGLRMEIIAMFGQPNKLFTICLLVLYSLPSFYFQFFRPFTSFFPRLILFASITILVGIAIVNFATVDYPLLHLSVTGVASGIVLSIIFILMVAHEILASFVYVASQATRQSKSLNHFLIISVVYMINLALAYAHKIGAIEWDFMYIDFYLLISISGILGIWGFRHRQPQYEHIIEADPFGVYLFLSLGAACFATIGYFIGTANDSALVTINDAIIYAHLGYGIIFLTYVISNFIAMLAKNLPVYKVLYKPTNMPYFTFRFGGIIATLAFVFYNTWQTPVQHAFSGYYNAAGDLYQTLGDNRYAEAFYQQASTYGFLNHHSNYAIANIEAKRNYNTIKERNYYDRASQRRPTEFSFLNLSQTYQRNREWLSARLTLNDALKHFPDSGPIKNTLGIIYSKLNLPDSSLHYLQQATRSSGTREVAETNFIGVAAKNNLSVNADSLFTLIASENQGTKSNALAFANIQGTKIDMGIETEFEGELNLFSASMINNYLLNHLNELDSSLINQVISIGKNPVNEDYREALLFASSLALYANGQTGMAFSLLEEVTIYSNDQDRYNSILAMWSLENRAPTDAASFINYVLDNTLPVVALSLTEAGHLSEATIRWDSLRAGGDSTYVEFATSMIKGLGANRNSMARLSDIEKFLFANYKVPVYDSIQFDQALNQIVADDLKARAILTRSERLFELDEVGAAVSAFRKIEGLQLSDRNLYNEIIHFELELIAAQGNLALLSNKLKNESIKFVGHRKSNEVYFKTLVHESDEDSAKTARQFRWLASANPYQENAVIAAANYYKQKANDNLLAYSILTEALHANPHSVKLLKAYSLEAAAVGFSEYAQSALERLRPLMSAASLRKFLTDNQSAFAQVIQ